jgi:integrase
LPHNPSKRIDLPNGDSKRPKRIASPAEAAALLAALTPEDRPAWATAFYAGLRRGELQALRVRDIDREASLIAVERGWDQVAGVIEPKSRAGRRSVLLLTVLRDYLDTHMRSSGRSGDDLLFGRTSQQAFSPQPSMVGLSAPGQRRTSASARAQSAGAASQRY